MILSCTPTRTGKACLNLLDSDTLKLKKSNIHDIHGNNLHLKLISLKGHAFLFSISYTRNLGARMQRPIYKYSPQTNTLQSVGELPDKRTYFSVCGLMNLTK